MTTAYIYARAHDQLSAAIERRFFRNLLSAILVIASVLPARAIPPPPPKAPLVRQARMVVTVHLIEAKNGQVSKRTRLCEVSGKIPVYSDKGRPVSFPAREIEGCTMPRNGENLSVSVWGAKAISKNFGSFATAGVSVVPPDAVPGCIDLCGPQPLADSQAEIRVSGSPKRMNFSLNANPVSVLKAKPTVWLEADIEIVD